MSTGKASAADLIELLIAAAPRLHAVGITSLQLDGRGGASATLERPPPADTTVAGPASPPRRSPVDPLRDPRTYPAGRVPGYPRDKSR